MANASISKDVANFLAAYIDSVMQLEVLLLLYARRTSTLRSSDVAHDLRIDLAWTEAALANLAAAGILVYESSGYRYSPRAASLDQTIAELANAYEDRRVTIISMIFSKPADPIRQFTDAFRFRKDEGN